MRADARRNRDLIIAAAHDLFAEVGADVPVDEIAKHAGVGTGTFYRHFDTKEALIEAVLVDKAQLMLQAAREAVRAKDPGEALFSVLSRLVSHQGRKRDSLAALVKNNASFREATTCVINELWDVVGLLLLKAQTARRVRDDIDLKTLKAVLTGTCVSLDMADGERALEQKIWLVFLDGLHRT